MSKQELLLDSPTQNILFFERNVIQPQGYPLEERIVNKVHGRDVRVTVPVFPDGTTVFDHQLPKEELFSRMMERIDTGKRSFDNYPLDPEVLDRSIFYIDEDAIGSRTWLAELYLLGDHYENNVGIKIPQEEAWNPYRKDETKAFVQIGMTPYEPERIYASLLTVGSKGFSVAERVQRENKDTQIGFEIEQIIIDFRSRQTSLGNLQAA